jgi:hypothetical protein
MWVPIIKPFERLLGEYLFAFLFLLLVAAWLFVTRLPRQIRSIRAASWPVAQGKVETVGINAFAGQSLTQIGYSYSVEGVRHSGYFARQFADEQDAWSYAAPLKDQAVVVRYEPVKPEISTLVLHEQNDLFRVRVGSFPRRFLNAFVENLKSSLSN